MDLLFTFLWKSSLIITLFYVFYKLFLSKETYFRSTRYFLLLGCAASIIVPLIIVPIYIEATTRVSPEVVMGGLANSAQISSKLSFDWSTFIKYIYISMSMVFLIRLLIQLISIVFLIRGSTLMKSGNFYYVETDADSSPFSFFNFIVYNPKQFTKGELDQILAHEKVHAMEKHSLDTLLLNLLIVVQWFNPFAWLYKKDIEQNLEFIADEHAIKAANSKQSYQQLLLKTTVPNYQMALANNFYNSLLKKRIIMLHRQRSNNKSQWKFALILPLLFAFIFSFNTKTIAQKKDKVKVTEINIDVYAMGIDKESSKADLDEIVKNFAEKGLTVKFSGLKRNTENNITAIKIDAKAQNGKTAAAYSADDDEGIKPIQISFDKDNNSLSIGSSDRHNIHGYSFSNNGHTKIIKRGKGKGNNFILHSDDDDNTWINKKGSNVTIDIHEGHDDDDGLYEIIIDEDDDGKRVKKEVIKIRGKKGKGKRVFISTDDDDDENTTTSYIVNGKKISKEALKKMDPDKIETIEIKKEKKKVKKKN